MEDKEKEIAATNKLLNVIRGDNKHVNAQVPSYQAFPQDNQIEKPGDDIEQREVLPDQTAPANKLIHKRTPPSLHELPSSFQMHSRSGRQKGFLQKWLRKGEKKAVGLDIGSHSIKFVLIQKGISGVKTLDYKIVELPTELGEDRIAISAKMLKSMLAGIDLDGVKIVSSVSGPSVIVRHVQFPSMSEKELAQSLSWEAKSYIPFPLNEINLDYQILPRKEKEQRLDVILVAVTKKMLRSHLEILESVSLKPDIVDIDPLVLVNTYLIINDSTDEKTVALINMGAQSSTLSIYRQGSLFFTRDVRIGGNAFTKQIQSQWKVSYEQAESIKKGSVPDDLSSIKPMDLPKIFKPVLAELISEIRRSLIYYDNQTGKKGFGHIILTGGGSLLKDLPDFLASELGLEVKFLSPFKRLHMDDATYPPLLIKEQAERLSLSVGLALRGVL